MEKEVKNKNNTKIMMFVNIIMMSFIVLVFFLSGFFCNEFFIDYFPYVNILVTIISIVYGFKCLIEKIKKDISDKEDRSIALIIVSIIHFIFAFQFIIVSNMTMFKKPIIYIYPTDDIDLKIKLENEKLIGSTYPEYDGEWNIHVSKDSNIYDYKTKRNYYSLFFDAYDNTKIDLNEGFVVKKEETVKFLEEKLEYLGLNEREINEFIIYWIDELEKYDYNYIRFRTREEIDEYMPITFSKEPDTFIRVYVDFKGLNYKKEVKEQNLTKVERKGYTIVEWGGRLLK